MKKYFCLLFIIGLFIIVGCGKSSKEIEVNYVDYKDSELRVITHLDLLANQNIFILKLVMYIMEII